MKIFKNIGPATLIAAAFIGPGTVSVCALAGFNHGMTLIWVMFVAMFMTIFLQELSARLAIIHQMDLTELLQTKLQNNQFLKILVLILIFIAIVFGNAAYEAGNLSGINIGLQILDYNEFFISVAGVKINYAVILISLVAFFILHIQQYRYIEKTLMVLVGILSVCFMITAVITSIENQNFWSEIFSASFPIDDFLILTALIGTTVVPYNLFLHAALAKQKWKSASDVSGMRIDTISAVFVGILVSICIIIVTANVSDYTQDIKGIGLALKPLFGEFSIYLVGIGYVSAGLTSSITAPLAAAYVLNKLFSLNYNPQSLAFKRLSYSILFIGCIIAALDFNPMEVIRIAQVANAIILPVLVILLIWLAYKFTTTKMSWWFSIFSFLTLSFSISISFSSIYKIFFQ